jgi:hypothetical protein
LKLKSRFHLPFVVLFSASALVEVEVADIEVTNHSLKGESFTNPGIS